MSARDVLAPAVLVVRVGTSSIALPVSVVRETLRLLPIEPVPGAPEFVLGLTILRGAPVPVVDLGALLEGGSAVARPRLVSVRTSSDRGLALAVDDVVELRHVDEAELSEVPPLLREARSGGVARVAALDRELLHVLDAARLVTHASWWPAAPERRP